MAYNLMPIDLFSAKNLSAADKANLFTERMSSTAHQREVADLKAAGLNPVLSADSSGATTGSAAVDDEEKNYSNPLYNLISNVNKISSSTAKTYSQAINNLNKTVRQALKVTEKAVKNSSDDNLRSYSGSNVTDEAVEDIVDQLVEQSVNPNAHSQSTHNTGIPVYKSDDYYFKTKNVKNWDDLSKNTKSFLSTVGNILQIDMKDAVNKSGVNIPNELAKILTFGMVDNTKGLHESGGIDTYREYHSAKEKGSHSGVKGSFASKSGVNIANDVLNKFYKLRDKIKQYTK